jgi:hypothetical protein
MVDIYAPVLEYGHVAFFADVLSLTLYQHFQLL